MTDHSKSGANKPESASTPNLTVLIEGFYDGSLAMIPDTVTVELRDTSPYYLLVDKTKIFINSDGNGSGNFAVDGTPYYIVVKHRNGIETWSATPQTFISGTLTYDFTTAAANNAYGIT